MNVMMSTPNFDVYARKSVYREESESIENQIKMCKEYIFSKFTEAKDENIFIYKDEGFSGKDTNRPQFQRMMENIRKRNINYFVCYKIDRVARSVVDFANFIQKLESKRIEFISVKDNIDTSANFGRAMLYMAAIFAELERKQIAERVKDGMMYLATKGRHLGGRPPTGFTSYLEEKIDVDGKGKTSYHLQINENIATIKLIFEKFLECGSSNHVARYLDSKGIKTVNNVPYYDISIHHILGNPIYCTADKIAFDYFKQKGSHICFSEKDFSKKLGIIAFNRNSSYKNNDESKWILSLGKHRGVISGKNWVNVQNILSKRQSLPRTYSHHALLSGLITCENCGSHMLVATNSRCPEKNKFSYTCKRKNKLGLSSCNIKNLIGPEIEQKIINHIMNFDETKLKKDLHIKKLTRKTNKFQDQVEELKFEIHKFQDDKNKYLEHLLSVSPNSNFAKNIQSKIDSIDSQIEKLNKQKHTYETQFNLAFEEKVDVEQILKNLQFFKQNFLILNFDQKKSLLRLILNKLTWNGVNLKIFLTGEKT